MLKQIFDWAITGGDTIVPRSLETKGPRGTKNFQDRQKISNFKSYITLLYLLLPYSFRLIGPQTKQGNMHPCSAEIGLGKYGRQGEG